MGKEMGFPFFFCDAKIGDNSVLQEFLFKIKRNHNKKIFQS